MPSFRRIQYGKCEKGGEESGRVYQKGKTMVGDVVAAEAQIKFMLVDDEKI